MINSWILGVDPGGTTGVSLKTPTQWLTLQYNPEEFSAFFLYTIVNANNDGSSLLKVVAERFVPSTRHLSNQSDALELIGFMKYACLRSNIPFELQSPAAAKGLAPNPVLKHIGAYAKKTPHGNDAARHAALYISKKYPAEWRSMLGGYNPYDTKKA